MSLAVLDDVNRSPNSPSAMVVRLLRSAQERQREQTARPTKPAEPRPPAAAPPSRPEPTSFRPTSQEDLAPAGPKAKARANLMALRTLSILDREGRPATVDEQRVLAQWASWGALPKVFEDTDAEWAPVRQALRQVLSSDEWTAAARTTINAHYTSAEVVGAIWDAVCALGFRGGRVLEPGCGSGNFIGLAPDLPMQFVGVELDPTTARIARALYPHADIRAEGFERTKLPLGHFDLAIGNVPFGKIVLHDPTHNKGRRSMHNHFLIKALHLVKPGGVVAMVTSRFTLDSRDAGARDEMASLAELVTAVRLPAGSMRAAAGTDVIMDVLVLRRTDSPPAGPTWRNVMPVETPDGPVEINEFFAAHRDQVLGVLGCRHGQYNENDLTIRAHETPLAEDLALALHPVLERPARVAPPVNVQNATRCAGCGNVADECFCFIAVPDDIVDEPLVDPDPEPLPMPVLQRDDALGFDHTLHQEGSILRTRTGFARLLEGVFLPFEATPRKDAIELGALCDLRDCVLRLLHAQANRPDDTFLPLQADLNARYDLYVAKYGPLNRFKFTRTGQTDHDCRECGHEWVARSGVEQLTCPECREPYEADGTERMKTNRPRMGGFRADPAMPILMALEVFDPESQTATKADLFSKRVVAPRAPRGTAASPQDALSICLDEHGRVDIDYIAKLLDTDPTDARNQLGEHVWLDPEKGTLVAASEYLSGNVRHKLAVARRAAESDPDFTGNIVALEAVVPPDLRPAEIDARLGAPWIPVADVEQFALETFFERSNRRYASMQIERARLTATWTVAARGWERNTVLMTSTWGTRRADALDLLQDALNQKATQVFDTVHLPDGRKKQVLNTEETFAAQEKQATISERFSAWMWEDPERADRNARLYNELFNSVVVPTFDGSHLTTPGRSLEFHPHPHQLNAVWRVLQSPTTLLAHAVGAGKTACMAMSAMELRRLGLVRKPAVIVPNHMLQQVSNEMLQLYPLARILVPTDHDTSKDGRKHFVARCAMGDWDIVVLTHSAFGRIPVAPETERRYIQREIDAYTEAIHESKEQGHGLSVKKLERAKLQLEERLRDLLDSEAKDGGVNFESTGIDYLFCDEAQCFKNLRTPSRIEGVGGRASKRASDLDMKLWYLRRKFGDRVTTFSTATPISNSVAEMFVMQSYLQPDRLAELQINRFDAWAATFGSTVTALELAPDGGSYRMKQRFAKFHNVPELMSMFRMVADVLTPEMLQLSGIPELKDGKAKTAISPPCDTLTEVVKDLVERARLIRDRKPRTIIRADGEEAEDNILVVCTDGRKAALDLRLVGEQPDPNGGKLGAAAENIATIWKATRDHTYIEPNGLPSARKGAFQLVFADLGTPKDGRWNIYAELRRMLVGLGVPLDGIRFVHEAKDAADKAALFADCRAGRVDVLIGSTAKMGIGTNVQTRLIALHHLDCPWRPDEIEQREGRAIRQGNQNPEVAIYRYATEGSFDVYLWQTVERKAKFIHQVMSGQITTREIDDVGDAALSYAEMKALASGNPLILEKAGVDNDVARLRRKLRAHEDDQRQLEYKVKVATGRVPQLKARLELYEKALEQRVDVGGDAFSIKIGEQIFDKRNDEAGEALLGAIDKVIAGGATGVVHEIGSLAGFKLECLCERRYEEIHVIVRFGGSPAFKDWTRLELRQSKPVGLLAQLVYAIQALEEMRDNLEGTIRNEEAESAAAQERIGQPFEEADHLAFMLRRQADIDARLKEMEEKDEEEAA